MDERGVNSGPGSYGVPDGVRTDGPGFSLCAATLESFGPVKQQNTTRSWSGEPELTEGTWLQLMCCIPSRLCCPKFRSSGVHGVYDVFQSTPEETEKTERLEFHANGCTMVDIRTDPIIHDLFVYVSMGMNVSMKQKDNKTVMGHNKHNNQKWNITRSSELRIGDKSENGEQ